MSQDQRSRQKKGGRPLFCHPDGIPGRASLLPLTQSEDIWELFDLYIDLERRRQGLGAKVVRHALEVAKQEGAEKVQVHVPKEYCSWWAQFGFRYVCDEAHMEADL